MDHGPKSPATIPCFFARHIKVLRIDDYLTKAVNFFINTVYSYPQWKESLNIVLGPCHSLECLIWPLTYDWILLQDCIATLEAVFISHTSHWVTAPSLDRTHCRLLPLDSVLYRTLTWLSACCTLVFLIAISFVGHCQGEIKEVLYIRISIPKVYQPKPMHHSFPVFYYGGLLLRIDYCTMHKSPSVTTLVPSVDRKMMKACPTSNAIMGAAKRLNSDQSRSRNGQVPRLWQENAVTGNTSIAPVGKQVNPPGGAQGATQHAESTKRRWDACWSHDTYSIYSQAHPLATHWDGPEQVNLSVQLPIHNIINLI